MYNSRQLPGLMDKNIDALLCVYSVRPTKNLFNEQRVEGQYRRLSQEFFLIPETIH